MATNRRGKAKLPEYGAWADMLQRCKNPRLRSYHLYGGRGVKVCERWLSFDNFYSDMGSKQKGYTLERLDNDGDYEPANCKWVSPHEQAYNRRTNHLLTIGGTTKTVTQWANEAGLKPVTVFGRIRRCWFDNEVLGPIRRGRRV